MGNGVTGRPKACNCDPGGKACKKQKKRGSRTCKGCSVVK